MERQGDHNRHSGIPERQHHREEPQTAWNSGHCDKFNVYRHWVN